jgi:DNA-binding MarR family transcriptional regulator
MYMQLISMTAPLPIPLPCACATLRRASRALTSLYDHALQPLNLRATQFTVLQSLSLAGEMTQKALGEMLAMDSTTLTRTLAILVHNGWIARQIGKDRREWRIRLSKAGEAQLNLALPHWENVQTRLQEEFDQKTWKAIFHLADKLTIATTNLKENTQ